MRGKLSWQEWWASAKNCGEQLSWYWTKQKKQRHSGTEKQRKNKWENYMQLWIKTSVKVNFVWVRVVIFQEKQEHWNKKNLCPNVFTFARKPRNIEHNIECMLQTHPPESCEVPRCRNDEMKPNARKSLNHTHACKNKIWNDNVAIIITLWTTAEDTA